MHKNKNISNITNYLTSLPIFNLQDPWRKIMEGIEPSKTLSIALQNEIHIGHLAS